jgi:hypothetical protein
LSFPNISRSKIYAFFTGPFDSAGFFVSGFDGFGFLVGLGFVGVFGLSVALAALSSGFFVGEAAATIAKRVKVMSIRNALR